MAVNSATMRLRWMQSAIILVCAIGIGLSESYLYTDSRWIVNENGSRVKLACVNWASHVESMLAEGLNKRALDDIPELILNMGFNCVRLTWALFMFTNSSLGATTARQSLTNLGLHDDITLMQMYNPQLVDMPVVDIFHTVVDSLDRHGVMIILDNHISRPMWCCSASDGNGFFGDSDFDPALWMHGLKTVASTFNSTCNVVAMSLRNELRGPRQNVHDWYKYMQAGAEVVHGSNPNVLVILSGLSFDLDLSFLKNKRPQLSFQRKLLFELHWYAFSGGQSWATTNANDMCASVWADIERRAAFLLNNKNPKNPSYPLILSEFGVKQEQTSIGDSHFVTCVLAWAAQNDIDWAYWPLQGSYYIRSGRPDLDETYGLVTRDWSAIRNPQFLDRLWLLQRPLQGSSSSIHHHQHHHHQIIYHPTSGLCLRRRLFSHLLYLGSCDCAQAWHYDSTGNGVISVVVDYGDDDDGGEFPVACVRAAASGAAAELALGLQQCDGDDPSTQWLKASASGLHVQSMAVVEGTRLCLDGSQAPAVLTLPCSCLSNDPDCDPTPQWFSIVNFTNSLLLPSAAAAAASSSSAFHASS